MTPLKSALSELTGLFVDDGALAVSVVAVVIAAALVAALVPGGQALAGAVLLFGCIAVLAVNVIRAARR